MPGASLTLRTERLALVPATLESVRAEQGDPEHLARLLGATVPSGWPTESLVDALPWFEEQLGLHPEAVGWYGWYALLHAEDVRPVLAGSGGFLGVPDEAGQVEIGYSVLEPYQRRGLATEMVRVLTVWAFEQPGVRRVIARTAPDNPASVKVLLRSGFVPDGVGEPPESRLLFRLECPAEV